MMTHDSLKLAGQVVQLSEQQRIRFFHLLLRGICLHARGISSNARVPQEVRLLQSECVIEMFHRISEQMEHYFRRDDVQRPDEDLFNILYSLEAKARFQGLVSSAAEYAFKNLGGAL